MLAVGTVPPIRIRAVNRVAIRPEGRWVLYWMIAARRLDRNFALEHAVDVARDLGRPLVILEALRAGYPYASDRIHRFVIDGMADHLRRLERSRVRYHPYVEPRPGDGRGLLEALAEHAAAVVTDDHPGFFVPRMVASAGRKLSVRLEAVDSNGLLPMRAADRTFPRAHSFRRFLQRELPCHLGALPREHPLVGPPLPGPLALPDAVERRWPAAAPALLAGDPGALAALPIDHDVAPVPYRGGPEAARDALERFLAERLQRYDEDRNHPDLDATSGLSPYLHFGHLGTHEVFARLVEREGWSPASLSSTADGSRTGFWGMSRSAEAFLEELVTWRELGFNLCSHHDAPETWRSLPDWARRTLEEHAGDRRRHVYDLETFRNARTHDELWNAAQRQLARDGRIHNYLRMLWGKKILEWTRSSEEALEVMVHLNNKYALDGRDPNSYSGIFWVLGRYDRAWGPERPIYGKVRYMSSASTRKKIRLKRYLELFGAVSSRS